MGANTAVIAAEAISTHRMLDAAGSPCISPREALARWVTGFAPTIRCSSSIQRQWEDRDHACSAAIVLAVVIAKFAPTCGLIPWDSHPSGYQAMQASQLEG